MQVWLAICYAIIIFIFLEYGPRLLLWWHEKNALANKKNELYEDTRTQLKAVVDYIKENACKEGAEWLTEAAEAPGTTPKDLWEKCPQADWLLWLAEDIAEIDWRTIVRACTDCVRYYVEHSCDLRCNVGDRLKYQTICDDIIRYLDSGNEEGYNELVVHFYDEHSDDYSVLEEFLYTARYHGYSASCVATQIADSLTTERGSDKVLEDLAIVVRNRIDWQDVEFGILDNIRIDEEY